MDLARKIIFIFHFPPLSCAKNCSPLSFSGVDSALFPYENRPIEQTPLSSARAIPSARLRVRTVVRRRHPKLYDLHDDVRILFPRVRPAKRFAPKGLRSDLTCDVRGKSLRVWSRQETDVIVGNVFDAQPRPFPVTRVRPAAEITRGKTITHTHIVKTRYHWCLIRVICTPTRGADLEVLQTARERYLSLFRFWR